MAEGPAREEISDVCVVGAGPAGLTLARSLAAAGRRVLLLESGGARPSASAQELNAGDVRGERYAGLQSTRHRRIGGTPHLWDVRAFGKRAAKYAPLTPGDLKDWPLGWDELAPYYERAQALCGLASFRYAAEDWATENRRPFALDGTGLTSGVYQFGRADRWTRELVGEVRGAPGVTLAAGATAVGLSFAGGGGRPRYRTWLRKLGMSG